MGGLPGCRSSKVQIVQGARNPLAALLQDVGVDHGRRNILVAQQGQNGANIRAALQEVGGKTVAETVGGDPFIDPGLAHGHFDCLVDNAWIEVVAPDNATDGILRQTAGGKHILPAPFLRGRRLFALQGIREIDLTPSLCQVPLMDHLDPYQVGLQEARDRNGS